MQEKLTFRERIETLRPGAVIWPLLIILIILGVIVGSINYQKSVTENKLPEVSINGPEDNAAVTNQLVNISGKTDAGAKLTINDKTVTVGKDGQYSAQVKLSAGTNTLTIVATGTNGKSVIKTRRVAYVVPTPVATTQVSVPGSTAKLSSSGPEDYWIPEVALIVGAFVTWSMTKEKLNKTLARR